VDDIDIDRLRVLVAIVGFNFELISRSRSISIAFFAEEIDYILMLVRASGTFYAYILIHSFSIDRERIASDNADVTTLNFENGPKFELKNGAGKNIYITLVPQNEMMPSGSLLRIT
jgi:hypothetical protein